MKFQYIVLGGIFLSVSFLYSIDIRSENIDRMLDKGGKERIQAIWLSFDTKQYFLLKKVAKYLLESPRSEEHELILRIFMLLGDDLEIYIPDWYSFIDKYVDIKRPEKLLMYCLQLTRKWKEQRLIFATLRLLKHPDHQIRFEAIQTLKELNSDVVLPVLIQYLKDSNELLNIYGLEGVQQFPDERLIPFVRELVVHPNKTVRIYALKALAEFENESYYIVRNFSSEQNEEVLKTIISLIGKKRWYQYSHLIHQAITHKSSLVRESAMESAGKLKNPRFSYTISKRLLIERDVQVIRKGIWALAKIHKDDPFRSLIFLLNHKNPQIRIYALQTIQKLKLYNYFEDILSLIKTEKNHSVHLELVYTLAVLMNKKNIEKIKILLLQDILNTKEKFLILTASQSYLSSKEYQSLLQLLGRRKIQ